MFCEECSRVWESRDIREIINVEENQGTSLTIWRKIQGPVQPYGGNSRDQSNHMDKNPGINPTLWRNIQVPVQPYGRNPGTSPTSSSVSHVSIAKEWHKENDLKAIYVEFL